MSKKYAITEIITTGLSFKLDRIIHISTFIIEDQEIKKHLTTYINPERSLEPEVIRSTGIQNDNIKFSPKFYEKAKDLIMLWDGAILMSSNIRMTYTFLKNEFESLGFQFNMNHIPYPNYDYEIVSDHRIEDKSRVLASHFLDQQLQDINLKKDFTPRAFLEKEIKLIPNECGIYLLKNQSGSIVYVGKAIKIRTRLRQHFRNLNNKGFKIHQMVAAIDHKMTGSELFALLLEQYYILKYKPELNKALRGNNYKYELRLESTDNAFLYFIPSEKPSKGIVLKRYKNKKSAIAHLGQLLWINELSINRVKFYGISDERLEKELEEYIIPSDMEPKALGEIVESINPYYNGKYIIRDAIHEEWIAVIEYGKFLGISKMPIDSKSFQTIKDEIEYPFQSEYALSLIISKYRKGELLTFGM